eukprot:m.303657 g.303657  ORF g.303657 m.303657 type:complete len:160 (+) comp40837_c0_seq15:48-527(+)
MAGAGAKVIKLTAAKPTQLLLEENTFKRWDDEVPPHDCILRVDELGLLLRVSPAGKDSSYLDLCHVSDIRLGVCAKQPKDAKMRDSLGDHDVESRMISVVYGSNTVDVNFANFVAPSADLAAEWARDLTLLTHNIVGNNGNVMHFLRKVPRTLVFEPFK